jgi:hypothetical protein
MRALANQVRTVALLGRVLLLLLPIVGGGCDWNRSRFIPDDLVGVWRTDDPRYRDRTLELGKANAVIGVGADKPSIESVESVKIQPAGEDTNYSIDCRGGDGTRHLLTLRFSPNAGGEIRLSHPPNVVWKRRPDGHTLPDHRRVLLVPRPLYEIDCIKRNCSREW